MRKTVVLAMAAMLATGLAGCLDVHRAVVPSTIVTTADVDWEVTNGDPIEDSTFAPKAIETQYLHDPENDDTYPAVLVLVGLRTITRIDEQDLLDVARGILEDEMADQGLEPDRITEQTGTRTIKSGATTQWLTMLGNAESGSLLFSQAEQIRMAAEAWYDEESRMHVVAIAIAQTGGTDIFGQARTEMTAWNELVGDDNGSIGGARHSEGFIDHVIVED